MTPHVLIVPLSEPETLLQLSVAPGHQEHLIIRLSLATRRLQDTSGNMMEVSTKPPDPVTRLKRLL